MYVVATWPKGYVPLHGCLCTVVCIKQSQQTSSEADASIPLPLAPLLRIRIDGFTSKVSFGSAHPLNQFHPCLPRKSSAPLSCSFPPKRLRFLDQGRKPHAGIYPDDDHHHTSTSHIITF